MWIRKRQLALVLLAGAAACAQGHAAPDAGASFVALDHDFAGYSSWYQLVLPHQALADVTEPMGPRVGFLNRRPPSGASEYPIGTIIVKEIHDQPDPNRWPRFAMAKRALDFNASGAVGWEFFLLRIDAQGNPYITSRGLSPHDDGFDGSGDSYRPGGAAGGCNLCHGQPVYAAHDHIISDPLFPRATAR
jgi:hypothetical protein